MITYSLYYIFFRKNAWFFPIISFRSYEIRAYADRHASASISSSSTYASEECLTFATDTLICAAILALVRNSFDNFCNWSSTHSHKNWFGQRTDDPKPKAIYYRKTWAFYFTIFLICFNECLCCRVLANLLTGLTLKLICWLRAKGVVLQDLLRILFILWL